MSNQEIVRPPFQVQKSHRGTPISLLEQAHPKLVPSVAYTNDTQVESSYLQALVGPRPKASYNK